ncbi:hypothetical protein APUTEX25_001163, partial [Auxenochlorella protothecoides]
MPGFKLPAIDQNDEDWGPTTVPEAFRDVPFMPYSKGDRLGRIADFSQQASQRGYQGRYRDREILPGMAVFNFEKGEEVGALDLGKYVIESFYRDEAFELVDTRVFDPKWSGIDWRSKLENQRGAALATELKNNAAKVAKWTAAALMAGVDVIKLGYVTRASPKSSEAHLLLGTQSVKPADFAAQMNLSMDNAWGIVRALLELCYDTMEEDGTYLLVRDPNKPQLRLYAVPTEASRAKAEAKKEAAEAEAPEAAAAPETPEE